ncbi:MAG: trypsin-like peptidase domain-containing protein [Candidatus Solibacter sp.]
MEPSFGKGTVVTVGEGRGFVVETAQRLLIITAAHCLPFFPPPISFSGAEECTYRSLVGPLGRDPTISAMCYFADPIGDIAVLGPPDEQLMSHQWDEYEAMLADARPFSVSESPTKGPAWLLSLKGEWFQCQVWRPPNGQLFISQATKGIEGGMSGSPILAQDGSAMGVICTSDDPPDDTEISTEGGPHPALTLSLPGWLLRNLPKNDGSMPEAE